MTSATDLGPAPRRAGGLAAATLVVTAGLVGTLALAWGRAAGVGTRTPWYLLVGAVGFVGAVLAVEQRSTDPRAVLGTAVGVAAGGALVVGLAVEGALFAVRAPGRVFGSGVVLYVLAAALVGTGLGYWLLRHWTDLTGGRHRRTTSASTREEL